MKVLCQAQHFLVLAENVRNNAPDFFVAGELNQPAHEFGAQTGSLPTVGDQNAEFRVV